MKRFMFSMLMILTLILVACGGPEETTLTQTENEDGIDIETDVTLTHEDDEIQHVDIKADMVLDKEKLMDEGLDDFEADMMMSIFEESSEDFAENIFGEKIDEADMESSKERDDDVLTVTVKASVEPEDYPDDEDFQQSASDAIEELKNDGFEEK